MQWFAVSLVYWLASSNFVSITFIRALFVFSFIVPDIINVMINGHRALKKKNNGKFDVFHSCPFSR